ncbi:hypothetical protein OL233_08185 [Vagococcus sp. PNs007]|uniref:Uncharacterized protein n=1 Tax=Vagococcus proximus TaxID=2991417 RepID=A0ABT5X2N0_9ENTE|nr:hypothetical protein [Vagococcus proximus]MDF0480260.1 hypothetical protein [Vagococcus proximus]
MKNKNDKFLGITLEYWAIITGLFAVVFLFCLSFKVKGNYSWLTVTKLA